MGGKVTLTRQALQDRAAFEYLRDVLSQGRSLSQRLLHLDFESGRLWTYLRSDVSVDYAQAHLNETWLVVDHTQPRDRVASPESLFVDFIQQHLKQSARACCLIEDALRKADEPYVMKHPHIPYVFYAGDVFYLLRRKAVTPEKIAQGLKETSAWVQTALLTHVPADGGDILPRTELTDEQLTTLVGNMDAILVSAFDQVSYVVWEVSDRTSEN